MTQTLNKFEDINHLPLRVFNRVVFLNNLFADSGKGLLKDTQTYSLTKSVSKCMLCQPTLNKKGLTLYVRKLPKGWYLLMRTTNMQNKASASQVGVPTGPS